MVGGASIADAQVNSRFIISALAAEKMDHHPDWSNSWNKVTVDLSTHSAAGLTKNDVDLATKIQQICGA